MRAMMVRRGPVLAVLCFLGIAACSMGRGAEAGDAPQRAATTVTVENNNWMDMVVYAVRSSMRVRLGMVNSMNSETFRVPATLTATGSSIRLEAHPIGSQQSYIGPPVQMVAGRTIEFTIQNHLSLSSVAVW